MTARLARAAFAAPRSFRYDASMTVRVHFWGTRGSIPVALTAGQVHDKIAAALVAADGRRFANMNEARAFARTELRRIALGATREGGWIEVLGGLAAGDRVVLDASIDADARIRPVESLKGEAP